MELPLSFLSRAKGAGKDWQWISSRTTGDHWQQLTWDRDMSLTGGNRVIIDRSPNLYLFVNEGGGVHRFEGRFMATGHETVIAEREGTMGEAIVFTLERVADEVRL